jgi:hypothetical protein
MRQSINLEQSRDFNLKRLFLSCVPDAVQPGCCGNARALPHAAQTVTSSFGAADHGVSLSRAPRRRRGHRRAGACCAANKKPCRRLPRHPGNETGGGSRCTALHNPVMTACMIHQCPIEKTVAADRPRRARRYPVSRKKGPRLHHKRSGLQSFDKGAINTGE